uniref:Uncharacterized protein n=3 Tax=Oryza TaxID=4527 RepID=Q10T12_ORYSJ|nr:Hypothetical protein [Oryza sativa Japonica Group]ABF93521.1 hypothetical protein LOC_Os03g01460 [Oryza sativa Japonica Group]
MTPPRVSSLACRDRWTSAPPQRRTNADHHRTRAHRRTSAAAVTPLPPDHRTPMHPSSAGAPPGTAPDGAAVVPPTAGAAAALNQRRRTTIAPELPHPRDGPALPLLRLHRRTIAHHRIPLPPERSHARDYPRQRRGCSPYCRSRCGARLATPDQRTAGLAPTDHCSAKPPPRSHVPLIPISGVFVFASPCPGSLRGGGGVAVPDRILPMRPWLSRSKCMRALAACRPALRQSGWPDAIGSEVCCPCARLLSFAMVLVWPPFD